MAQPTPYTRQYAFDDWQTDNPSDPLPAASLEQELDAIKLTTDEILANMALLQKDDGTLANNSVGVTQLDAGARALIEAEGEIRGAWVTATAYNLRDIVTKDNATYICAVAHTSGTFSTDLAAVKWVTLASFVDPMVGLDPGSVGTTELADGSVTAAKLASDAVTTAKVLDANITAAKLASNAVTTAKIADSNVTTAKIADLNITTAKIADSNVTTAKIADANVTYGKLAVGIFNQSTTSPATGDKIPFADASDSGNTKFATISDILALVTIPPSSGEANTASNAGSGAGLVKTKVGVDLPIRSLTAGSVSFTRSGAVGNGRIATLVSGTLTFTQNTNDVSLSLNLVYTNEPEDGGS